MAKRYTDEELLEYAQELGISIEEAENQWIEMDNEAEALAILAGISFEQAEQVLLRRELEAMGAHFAIAAIVLKHADYFGEEVCEVATAILKTRN